MLGHTPQPTIRGSFELRMPSLSAVSQVPIISPFRPAFQCHRYHSDSVNNARILQDGERTDVVSAERSTAPLVKTDGTRSQEPCPGTYSGLAKLSPQAEA